jgi:hypothetical protein
MKKFSEIIRSINLRDIECPKDIRETAEKVKQEYNDYHIDYLALRLAFGKNITIHTITDGALGFIKHTPIMEFPDKRPLFLNAPFIIEGRKAEPLFDDIIALGGFVDDEVFILTAIFQNGDHLNLRDYLAFDIYKGKKFEEVQFSSKGNITTPVDKQKKILSWAVSLGVMLESSRTPVLIEDKNKKTGRFPNAGYKKIVIYLTGMKEEYILTKSM